MMEILEQSKKRYKQTKKWLDRLKRRPPVDLDRQFQKAHEEVFQSMDCLHCANCCKTISPVFKSKDIERIAAHLKLKPGLFIDRYLRIDDEGDYVLQKSPCSFLLPDNTCLVYDVRPAACKSYPHTDRTNMQSLLPLTLKNTLTCPATAVIVERLQQIYESLD